MAGEAKSGISKQRELAAIPPNAVRLQVDRILASKTFSRSERMSRFLRFTVEQALAGRADELKEYLLGVEVFDRRSSYDPRVDPIVRVEARRLRSKLRTYYETEGRNDEIVIEYRAGSYIPRFHRHRLENRQEAQTSPAVTACSRESSIVVLPFANLSADAENEYFSDGLTQELIHALTKVEGLRVVAWQSAFQLKGKPYDLPRLGDQLGVCCALVGSVRRSGERLRIAAQLVNTADGRYLWSETYERQMRDVFAIQDEIASAIVGTLRLKLTKPPVARVVPGGQYDLQAYNLYLQGRFHSKKRTPEGLHKSIGCFEQAISIDAGFALGYAGLADSCTLLAEYGLMHPAQVMPKAKSAAEKALEIDPTLAEAHTSLALVTSLYEWNWQEGEEHYRRAIELNPGYATAHHWYACDYLVLRGRMEEALAEMHLAFQLDPISPIMSESVGYLFMLSRRYDDAIEQYWKVLDLDAHFYRIYASIGRTLTQKGMYQQAIEMLQKARSLCGDVPSILGVLGQTYGLAGRRAEARGLLNELAEVARKGYVSSTCFALIHLGVGEKDKAIDWLELACEQRELPVTMIKIHPAYDGLRSEKRFAALLSRTGLEW